LLISGEQSRISHAAQLQGEANKQVKGEVMIIPVRCFSCGKPIGQLWEKYKERVNNGEDPKEVMDELGLKRYCCRQIFLGHVDLIDTVSKYKKF
jgi:DNA-directed RNA polymerase subunit N (RpoN/RPB10)